MTERGGKGKEGKMEERGGRGGIHSSTTVSPSPPSLLSTKVQDVCLEHLYLLVNVSSTTTMQNTPGQLRCIYEYTRSLFTLQWTCHSRSASSKVARQNSDLLTAAGAGCHARSHVYTACTPQSHLPPAHTKESGLHTTH